MPTLSRLDFGFLYCATGPRYLAEAIQSATRSREIMPDVPIALFTDADSAAAAPPIFDLVHLIPSPSFSYDDKINAFEQCPFEKAVFVDTDTYWLAPAYELYELLDRFDLAYTHEVHRGTNYEPDCPECFPEPCTAVMAFRNCPATASLWQGWRERFAWEKARRDSHPLMAIDDQGAFRHVLYHVVPPLNTYVLPPEYNLRLHAPWLAGAHVKLLHGRGQALKRAIRRDLNRDILIRTGDGLTQPQRALFNLKRLIKNRILKKPARYDYRLSGLEINKPIPHLPHLPTDAPQ
jgi:hypothetical protein